MYSSLVEMYIFHLLLERYISYFLILVIFVWILAHGFIVRKEERRREVQREIDKKIAEEEYLNRFNNWPDFPKNED